MGATREVSMLTFHNGRHQSGTDSINKASGVLHDGRHQSEGRKRRSGGGGRKWAEGRKRRRIAVGSGKDEDSGKMKVEYGGRVYKGEGKWSGCDGRDGGGCRRVGW